MDHVEEMDVKQTQKTLLSALYILTGLEVYKTLMITICNEVNLIYKTQKLNPKQKANHVSWETVVAKYEQVKKLLKVDPTEENYVNYFVIACMSGVLWPPRRNEWVYVKLRNYNKEQDNYYDKSIFYFNIYKTAYKYKLQTIKVKKDFALIIGRWMKINKTDYLLYNPNTGKPLSSSDLTKRLHTIFGKDVGCSALRSTFLSHIYKDIPALAQMEKTAENMGHTLDTALSNYVKKD